MSPRTKKTKPEEPIDPFSELTWDDLEEWAGSRIVARGRSYQRKGAVRELQCDEEGALVAWVAGSRLYAARVSIEGGKDLICECTCPYWTTCKHAVAVVVEYLEMTKAGTAVGRVEADDPRLEELDAITEDDDEPLEFNVEEDLEEEPLEFDVEKEDLEDEPVETLSESVGSGQSRESSLRAYLQEHTTAELVELLLELAETHDEVRQSLENRRSLTSGETRRVLNQIRSEIATLEEPAWESHHYGYQVRDTDRLKAMLQALVASGQADAAVRLGPELLAAGTRALEYEHEAESTEAIGACLDVLFRALDRTSMSPADRIEWILDMALADEYELCWGGLENLWERDYTTSDWSEVCGRLAQRLENRDQTPQDDEFSRDYGRDLIADWLILALEKAGRRKEIVPLCKREAPITSSYNRLVDRLMAERAWEEARHWCRKGIEAIPDGFADLHAALREQLQTINQRTGNPLAGLALQAEEFFDRPSSKGFQALCDAAREYGVEEGVKAWGRHYLQTGRRPRSGRRRKGEPEMDWPLPAPEVAMPAPSGKNEAPMVDVLIRLAIDEKKPNEVVKWYDHDSRTKAEHWLRDFSLDDQVADAIASTHPDRAVAIWKDLAENLIALVKPRAYQDAVPYLRRVRDALIGSGRNAEWDEYLTALRQQNKRRPRCMEELDRLEGGRRRIIDG
ncbi:MAG: hypothetical protein OXH06_18930 [Gemmatimonadetes bacterium]|nr:hypothetical protein [Gemmatimonadota bacterium]